MNPPVPQPHELAVEQAGTARDDWSECRAEADLAPEKARALLAAAGRLLRLFAPADLSVESAAVLDLVKHDAATLLGALFQGPPPEEWLTQARLLVAAQEMVTDRDELRELEAAASELFEQLDRNRLALCLARRFGTPNGEWERVVAEAEDFLTDHADAFLSVATTAARWLDASRDDLAETDPDLWHTLLKHRVLDELSEELEAMNASPPVSASDRALLIERFRPPLVVVILRAGMPAGRAFGRGALPRRLLAAAEPAKIESGVVSCLSWRSPSGDQEVRLHLPTDGALDGDPIRLNVYEVATGARAIALAGRPLELAGLVRVLTESAAVDFTVGELRNAGSDLFLRVDDEAWEPHESIP